MITETLNEGLKRSHRITIAADALNVEVDNRLMDALPDMELKGLPQGQGAVDVSEKKAIRGLGARQDVQ